MIGRICLGLSLPLLLGAQVPEGWKDVLSKDGRFKAVMPMEPATKKQTVKSATGQLTVMMTIAEGKNDSVFVISYTDYPEVDLKKGAIEKRLDHARDGAVASAGGKLKSEQVTLVKGHPGRDIVLEKNGEIVARMRIVLVKSRLYQVMVLGKAPAEEVRAFLASFDLIE